MSKVQHHQWGPAEVYGCLGPQRCISLYRSPSKLCCALNVCFQGANHEEQVSPVRSDGALRCYAFPCKLGVVPSSMRVHKHGRPDVTPASLCKPGEVVGKVAATDAIARNARAPDSPHDRAQLPQWLRSATSVRFTP